jgi:hypothetical protein
MSCLTENIEERRTCLSILKKANKNLLNAEIMISDDLHSHTENCPRKANLLDWTGYEIKKYKI